MRLREMALAGLLAAGLCLGVGCGDNYLIPDGEAVVHNIKVDDCFGPQPVTVEVFGPYILDEDFPKTVTPPGEVGALLSSEEEYQIVVKSSAGVVLQDTLVDARSYPIDCPIGDCTPTIRVKCRE